MSKIKFLTKLDIAEAVANEVGVDVSLIKEMPKHKAYVKARQYIVYILLTKKELPPIAIYRFLGMSWGGYKAYIKTLSKADYEFKEDLDKFVLKLERNM